MKVLHVTDVAQRDACLARLCAEYYGQSAGLTPLVVFAGTRRVLFAEEAARLLALVDNSGAPRALALLVLDEAGEGMSVSLSCHLGNDDEPERRLIAELALKAPLRVDASNAEQEAFYRRCGITRWFGDEPGTRIGLAAGHPATQEAELAPLLAVDEQQVLRRFKHDAKAFEAEKRDFVEGLEAFPAALT
ncbi:hypothetical protein SAMN05192555_12212 [Franzmannia pantelleriensis]|uniref:Uncharacterized protein n=1 Tax=Franzmannia pantelleriensis TaxID=48727 RepID=A0A1G9WK35_9GAMM|nr:hypothetical protein [Halomonas pantelleriensis]SDM84898.1 hypothetical protein SAMN05192555_12212 [Halomonas pantelleriensis]